MIAESKPPPSDHEKGVQRILARYPWVKHTPKEKEPTPDEPFLGPKHPHHPLAAFPLSESGKNLIEFHEKIEARPDHQYFPLNWRMGDDVIVNDPNLIGTVEEFTGNNDTPIRWTKRQECNWCLGQVYLNKRTLRFHCGKCNRLKY